MTKFCFHFDLHPPINVAMKPLDEETTFDEIVRHLYEQKREVALNTFEFSIYRIFRSGGLDETKDLSENFSQLPIQITVCMPKKAVLILLRNRKDSHTTNTA